MGNKGAIMLRAGAFEINNLGEVYQDGELVDRLQVMKFKNPESLERVGDNYFYFGGAPDEVEQLVHPGIRQGFLEGSNVNAIKNMTAMIMAHRSYEAYQKAVSNFDQMMDKSSNSIGEVRA